MLHKKTGERVTAGEPLAALHVNRTRYLKEARRLLQNAFLVGEEKPECPPLIHGFL
jgi:thymidine phosphorylase